MKINIEIECTPEEARRFMGLPDVEKANEAYLEGLARAMKGAANAEQFEQFARQLAPMGQMGLRLFQSFMEKGSQAFADGAKEQRRPRDGASSDD